MDKFARGFAIEAKLGANLSKTFRTIDSWSPATGTARSIKSIDLESKTYQNPKKLGAKLRSYPKDIADFKGATGYDRHGNPISISRSDIKRKELEIAIPGKSTKDQQASINKITQEGPKVGVDVKTTRVD